MCELKAQLTTILFFCFFSFVALPLHRETKKAGEMQAPPDGWNRAKKGHTCRRSRQLRPLNNKAMTEELRQVADLITANIISTQKEVLTSDEAARYLGISKSYLYKLTMRQRVPHYKPMGKMCYFNRLELEKWLQSNRVATGDEISQQAQKYCIQKGGQR